MDETWLPSDVKMEDYWADAIGGEYRPVKHGKHSSFHPKTVKAVLDSVRGTEVADVIVGLVFALTKSDDLRRWANDQLLEEMKRSAALEEENRRLREALNLIDALDPEAKAHGFDRSALIGIINRIGEIARAALSQEDRDGN